ncbi:MAG: nucleotidyl transferase AbiEii/AbiGii toxin family protein [Saprospiraceae bacterium]
MQSLRLKVETNTKEHFSVLGIQKFPFTVDSSWFSGTCFITTYKIEELLGTKLRALYQRKKGRDLYDMYIALMQLKDLNLDEIIHCYKEYMNFSAGTSPTQKQYILNMAEKMTDTEFLGDITALIRPGAKYELSLAYELVSKSLIEKI